MVHDDNRLDRGLKMSPKSHRPGRSLRSLACVVAILSSFPAPASAVVPMRLRGGSVMLSTAWENAIERALDIDRLTSIDGPGNGGEQGAGAKAPPLSRSETPCCLKNPLVCANPSEHDLSASTEEGETTSSSSLAEELLTKELQKAEFVKSKGTMLFKACRYEEAALRYQEAKAVADENRGHAGSLKLSKACSLNLASCSIEMGDHTNSIRHCSDVLEIHPNNHKALFRRALSYQSLAQIRNGGGDNGGGKGGLFMSPDDWDKRQKRLLVLALQDVSRAFRIVPADKSVLSLLEKIRLQVIAAGVDASQIKQEMPEAAKMLEAKPKSGSAWKLAGKIAAGGHVIMEKGMEHLESLLKNAGKVSDVSC